MNYVRASEQEKNATEKAELATREAARADRETGETKKQLKESRRLPDLSRLREARTAFDRNQIDLAQNILDQIDSGNRCIVWRFLKRKFEGGLYSIPTAPVSCIAWHPDGSRFLAGGHDGTVIIWETRTGRELARFKPHKESVQSAE